MKKLFNILLLILCSVGFTSELFAQTGPTIDDCYTASGATLKKITNASGFQGPPLYQWQLRALNSGSWQNVGSTLTLNVTATEPKYYRLMAYTGLLGDPTQLAYSNVLYIDKPMIGAVENLYFRNKGSGYIGLQYYEGTVVKWEMKQGSGSWVNMGLAGQTQFPIDTITLTTQFRVSLQDCSASAYSRIGTLTIENKSFAGLVNGSTHVYSGSSATMVLSGHYGSIIRWEILVGATVTNIVSTSTSINQSNITATTLYRAVVKWQGITETSPWWEVVVVSDSPSSALLESNYIAVDIPTSPVTNESTVSSSNAIRTISFSDGLGRPVQQVVKSAFGAAGNDVVSFVDYDNHGQATRQYLPYTNTATAWEAPHTNVQTSQASFYNGSTSGVAENTQPYADVKMDDSPYSKVEKMGAPGATWDVNSAHSVAASTYFNTTADAIRKWDSDGTSVDEYAPGTLVKQELSDENENKVLSFTDRTGLLVCKKVQSATNTYLETYYVYDDYGRIRFIVPPEAMTRAIEVGSEDFDLLKTSTSKSAYTGKSYIVKEGATLTLSPGFTASSTGGNTFFAQFGNGVLELPDIHNFVFEFRYDDKGRPVEKKVPGADWEYIVYDKKDRPLLTQNAIQRESGQWLFVKYDRSSRPVYSGAFASSSSRVSLQDSADAATKCEEIRQNNPSFHGYSNQAFPTSNLEIHLVNYYDDYDFDRNGSADHTFSTNDLSGQATSTLGSTNKLPTGSKTLILGSSNWLINVVFYDNKGRPIQIKSNNHTHLAVDDLTTSIYNDWEGTIAKVKNTTWIDTTDFIVTNRYVYDKLGRVLQVFQKNGTDAEQELAAYEYNDLSQLISKKLHKSGSDYLQEIDYTYNERGWLKQINDPTITDDPKKFFALKLSYINTISGVTNSALYNGTISSMEWSGFSSKNEAYGFTYDKADRLTGADYGSGSGYTTNADAYNEEGISYDANGNLKTVARKSASTQIDNVTTVYEGNQLTRVNDSSDATKGFKNGANANDELTYNSNGYLTKDLNKNITDIAYNIYSKPVSITFGDGTLISYEYAANGAKLSRTLSKNGNTIEVIDYVTNYYVKNDTVQYFSSPEGRVVTNPTGGTSNGEYQYYLTDHIGNIRTVFTGSVPKVRSDTATFNTNRATYEADYFFNHNKYINLTKQVQVLDPTHKDGVGTILEVFPGDSITLKVNTYYAANTTNPTQVTGSALASLVSAIFSPSGLTGTEGATFGTNSGDAFGSGSSLLVNRNPTQGIPSAYINYIFFNRDFKFINSLSGFAKIGSAGSQTLTTTTPKFDEPGYLFVYLSYESTSGVPVEFDNFIYQHNTTRVLASNSFYPFGLESGQSWKRPENPMNRQLYNGGNERNEVSGYDETFYRLYDPALGRFMGVDPLASAYGNHSPYNYAMNNPISRNDPMGDRPIYFGDNFWLNNDGSLFDGGNGPPPEMLGFSGPGGLWYGIDALENMLDYHFVSWNEQEAIRNRWENGYYGTKVESGKIVIINFDYIGPYGGTYSNGAYHDFTFEESYNYGYAYNEYNNSWGNTLVGYSQLYETSVLIELFGGVHLDLMTALAFVSTEDQQSGGSGSLGDVGTGLSLAGEGLWLLGERQSMSLYEQGFRRGISGNYQLTGRNLSLFGNQSMSAATKPLSKLTSVGRGLSNLGTGLAVAGVAVDAYDYSNGNLSGARFGYHVTGTGASIGAAYLLGGPYGAAIGGAFFLGEKAWDMTQPLRDEISRQYWQFENALRSGWRPR